MSGTITTRHLVTEARAIIDGFGLRCYLRCWGAVIAGRRCTFLSLAW
jgi:hypothetical protein